MVLLAQAMLLDLDLPELDEADEIRAHGVAWEAARQRFERDMTVPSIPDSVARRLYANAPGHAGAAAPPTRDARPSPRPRMLEQRCWPRRVAPSPAGSTTMAWAPRANPTSGRATSSPSAPAAAPGVFRCSPTIRTSGFPIPIRSTWFT
jgi:hypothetical protein